MSPIHRHTTMVTMAVFLLSSHSLEAQFATLRGGITDTAATGLTGVEVVLQGLGRNVTTGSGGAFVLDSIPAGRHTILFRRVGYTPREFSHTFSAGETIAIEVVLGTSPVSLPDITVLATSAPQVSPRLTGFSKRRDAGIGGRFLEDSLLRTKDHSTLSQVLRRVSGVKMVHLPNGRGTAIASARGKEVTFATPHPDECYMSIYLDGLRVWYPGYGEPASIDFYKVVDLMAIEVYRSPAETPVEFGGSSSKCGVVALWTRDH